MTRLCRLSKEIDILKNELYNALNTKKALVNPDVYRISSKLDKLICEYQSIVKFNSYLSN